MNVMIPPALAQVSALNGQIQTEAIQDESGVFAATLEEKVASIAMAETSAYVQPTVLVTLLAAQEQEDTLTAQQVTMPQAIVPELQLMIQVDPVEQPLRPDTAASASEENTDLTQAEPLSGNGFVSDKTVTATTMSELASNGPTAAAQASLPVHHVAKREHQALTENPQQPVKAAEMATHVMTQPSQPHEISSSLTVIPDPFSAPVAGVSLSAQTLSQAQPMAQPTVVPVPSAVINHELGTEAWRQSLNQHISLFTRNGIHNAELRLNPQELGVIRINMQLNSDQATLHFVSESHQVRAALESAMPQLRTSLAESGIELGESSVGAESSSSWNGNDQPHHFTAATSTEEEKKGFEPALDERSLVKSQTIVRPIGINTFA